MDDIKIIKCPSCGSSQVEKTGESLAICSYCGSKLLLRNNKYEQIVSGTTDIKKLLKVVIILIVLISSVVLWILIKESSLADVEKTPDILKAVEKIPKINIPKINIPKVDSKAMGISNEQLLKPQEKLTTPNISVVSTVKGTTSIGGLFWIIQIRNEEQRVVERPNVVVSLFDNQDKRIAEQTGWSKLSHLNIGQSTEVLVLIAKPPTQQFRTEIVGRAKNKGMFDQHLELLQVQDYVINVDPRIKNRVVFIGDVYNNLEYQLDFVRVVAVAKNSKGVPVGIADSYVTNSSIPAQGQSGFKLTAGTFVAQTPASWSLYAIGRKQRDN